MVPIKLGICTVVTILLQVICLSSGQKWQTSDAIIQTVWPDTAKLKRASSATTNPNKEKQVPSKTAPPIEAVSQEDDDILFFEGRYFKPNEVPPPPPFMVVNNNWRGGSSPKFTAPLPPAPSPPQIEATNPEIQENPSYFANGRIPLPPTSQKFTAENAKINIENGTATESISSSNSKNILISSPIPLEDLQYHEEELIAFEVAYRDAPKCFTPTDVPGRCIPFRNCFPVVFNVINGDLRNPGLAKLLYQASGPCNASLELDFALEKLKDHKKFLSAKFYNQSICCPGFKHPPTLLKAWTNDPRNVRLIAPPSTPHGSGSSTVSSSNTVTISNFNGSRPENKGFVASSLDDTETNTPLIKEDSSVEFEDEKVYEDDADNDAPVEEEATEELEIMNVDDFVEREQLRLVETEIAKETAKTKVEQRNSTGIQERRGNKNKIKEVENSDTYLAVEPPGVAPQSCQQQLHGMPRGHWPWMVALVISSRHICSGALIDDKHVLTAAHCVYLLNEEEIKKLRLIIGDRVMYSSIDGPHFWRKVSKVTTHVNYNQQTFASDIAILKMNSPVPFSRNVQPISLPNSLQDAVTIRNGIVAGWSGADIGQPAFEPRTEVETVVEIMDKKECRETYRGFALNGVATNTFCTKPANNTCVADSGAPLIVRVQNCWRLSGIMSWGIGCSHFPEVYTDVSRFTSWIFKHST